VVLARNDLVVRLDEYGQRLMRVMRVREILGDPSVPTSRCIATAVVFDRVVPVPEAAVHAYRPATTEEIELASREGLLPPAVDDYAGGGLELGSSGIGEPLRPGP
jgi:hypothetical protein